MKKVYYIVLTILLASSAGLYAKTRANLPNLIIQKTLDRIDFSLSLGDLSKMSKEELNTKINKFIEDNVPSKSVLQCSVTVKGTVSVGVASLEISVTVSGTCDEIRKSGTAIANQILAEIKSALTQ